MRNLKAAQTGALVGALVLPLAVWTLAPAARASEAVQEPPVAFSMLLPTGVDLDSIEVTISPTPGAEEALQDGDSIDLLPVADGVTVDATRTLTVRVNPSELSREYISEGVVTFDVAALGLDGVSAWTRTVSPQAVVANGVVAWTAPEEVQPVPASSEARRRAQGGGLARVDERVKPFVGGALVRLPTTGSVQQTPSRAGRVTTVPGGNCMGPQPRKTKVESKLVWSTLGTTYPTGGSAATMQVDSSRGATYGIGASGSGKYGSWTASGSRTVKGGWGFTWTGSASSRSYRKQVRYAKFYFQYLDPRCDYFKWEPQWESGGTAEFRGLSRPEFWSCVPESAGDWYRDRSGGYSYEFGSAVKFGDFLGIDLSINRQYSESQSLKYHIVGTHHYLCGNGGHDPSIAGKLMERTFG